LAIVIAACGSPAPTEASHTFEPTRNPEQSSQVKQGIELGFPLSDDLWIIKGPHFIKDKEGTLYALDVSSSKVESCKPGDKKSITDVLVVAPKTGTIKVAGESKEVHSIVELDLENGYSLQLIHLDNIQVSVGQRVTEGKTIIGEMSCEFPPGGETDAIHLHMGLKKDGQPVSITGSSITGLQVKEDGTMKNRDPYAIPNWTVNPDPRRCGPSKESIALCDGKINYIPHPKNAKPGVIGPGKSP